MSNNFTFTGTQIRKMPTRKRPYFTMETAMTAIILRDASGKMHHGILFDRRLTTKQRNSTPSDPLSLYIILHYRLRRHGLVSCLVLKG